jgi:hypothetical protein
MLKNNNLERRVINKKAQVGETLTWIVATLVIIGTLLIFIYSSIALAKVKSINSGEVKTHIKQISGESIDWIGSKNQMAFSKNNENSNEIGRWINEKQTEESN